jgi:hypothetical protein
LRELCCRDEAVATLNAMSTNFSSPSALKKSKQDVISKMKNPLKKTLTMKIRRVLEERICSKQAIPKQRWQEEQQRAAAREPARLQHALSFAWNSTARSN